MAKIRAIIKRPDEKYGHVTNIENTLKNLQNTVDGYIETVPFMGDVMIVNENGKLQGLEPNFSYRGDTIVGTVAIVDRDGEEFGDATIDFKVWKRWLDHHGRFGLI